MTITENAPGIVETASGGANYTAAEIDTLPTGRTVFQIAELAPGLTDNTPNPEQISVSGSFSYDNVFLVDGVDVNDNLFGTINNLFIEEAIEEQAVITSGISAEYGRFSGGIVNTITKHGGNTFQGSLRANFTNTAWRYETPYELENGIRSARTRPARSSRPRWAARSSWTASGSSWRVAPRRPTPPAAIPTSARPSRRSRTTSGSSPS